MSPSKISWIHLVEYSSMQKGFLRACKCKLILPPVPCMSLSPNLITLDHLITHTNIICSAPRMVALENKTPCHPLALYHLLPPSGFCGLLCKADLKRLYHNGMSIQFDVRLQHFLPNNIKSMSSGSGEMHGASIAFLLRTGGAEDG